MRTALLGALLLAGSVSAGTIYQVDGGAELLIGADHVQVLYASWTQSASFSNVSISALLAGTGTASAYLTTQIGPGTDAGDVVASTTFPFGPPLLTTLFSGLSLGPGTYYLVIGGTGDIGSWYGTTTPVVTTGAGVTAGTFGFCAPENDECDFAFGPASPFLALLPETPLQFLVTEVAGVPEPATAATAGAALLALAGYWRLRQRSRPR
jgi:hypothetical protein